MDLQFYLLDQVKLRTIPLRSDLFWNVRLWYELIDFFPSINLSIN